MMLTLAVNGLILRFYVFFKDLRKPVIVQAPKSIAIQMSNDILECTVNANPSPYIVWFKDGKRLSNDGTYLTMKGVTDNDRGNFTCEATNSYGSKTSDKFSFDVVRKQILSKFKLNPLSPNPQNGQTHSNNSLAVTNNLFERA